MTSSKVEAAAEEREVEEVEEEQDEKSGVKEDLGVRGKERERAGEGEEIGVSLWNMTSPRAVVVIFCIKEERVGWDQRRRMYL